MDTNPQTALSAVNENIIPSEGGKDTESYSDAEYKYVGVEEGEDESTISEQETHEGEVNYCEELEALNKEGILCIDYLITSTVQVQKKLPFSYHSAAHYSSRTRVVLY